MTATRSSCGRLREQMTAVSKAHPCEVCGGDHKCGRGNGGLLICGRANGPNDGFKCLGPSKNDSQFTLYRRIGEAVATPGAYSRAAIDWDQYVFACAQEQKLEGRAERLAEVLGLPAAVLASLTGLGYDPAQECWTFPERDAAEVVIGILRRFPDGSKLASLHSSRGLTIVEGWKDRPGPAFLVEGPSDTLAMTTAGLSAVGRPSNTGGAAHLALLLKDLPPDRAIVVVGENDEKEDGSWPGRDGAVGIAETLTRELGRPVGWTLPPDGAKDVRSWLIATGSRQARLGRTGGSIFATASSLR